MQKRDGFFSYLKRFPLASALLRMGEFAVDTPRAATPLLTASPCEAQLCKTTRADGLTDPVHGDLVRDKQPRNKALLGNRAGVMALCGSGCVAPSLICFVGHAL